MTATPIRSADKILSGWKGFDISRLGPVRMDNHGMTAYLDYLNAQDSGDQQKIHAAYDR
jgi:hypothetical protein